VFSIQDRNRVRDHVPQMAASDSRIVAGAVVGSLALEDGDRYSDIDLTFGVAEESSIYAVLEDWTRSIIAVFDAAHLFDLPRGPSIYRVFLIPGCLQFDLSFTPASQFGATGPKFRLLFGECVERAFPQPPTPQELFGYAVHHVLRARFCIERGRYWHAEYWISSARDYTLSLACLRRGLPTYHGRGYDDLPPEVLAVFSDTFVTGLTRDELIRTLARVIDCMLLDTNDVSDLAVKIKPQLQELTAAWEA
jgi:hypothetical protein